jgi:hypothetical protein
MIICKGNTNSFTVHIRYRAGPVTSQSGRHSFKIIKKHLINKNLFDTKVTKIEEFCKVLAIFDS